jgi:DNA repair exonuclease SbcCD ATPase subunit
MNIQRSAKTRSELELDTLRKRKRETEDLLKKIIDKDDNTKALESKRLHVQKLIDQVGDLKAEMEESIREKLTKSVSEIFFSILPNTVFNEIRIDSNYSLTLHSDDGRQYMANNLSTGQAKALGLSLAYGLSKDMGYSSTPMLIDNLYGDIKDTHFEDVTHMIEALSKNKQIVVMDLNVNKSLPLFSPNTIKQTFTINRLKSEYKTVITEGKDD